MPDLSQIVGALRSYQDNRNSQSDTTDVITQANYMRYVNAMESQGYSPLSREEWIAAGQPTGV